MEAILSQSGADLVALIRLGRAVRHLSQRALAQRAGIAPMRFWRLENRVAAPRPGELQAIAQVLDLSALQEVVAELESRARGRDA